MNQEYKSVLNWFLSFIPLVVAAILFVFCFIFEKRLTLYLIMAASFMLFALLFVQANRRIVHKDGYTLVQAMSFARSCKKAGICADSFDEEKVKQISAYAEQFEYAEDLNENQIIALFKIGDELNRQFKR